MSTGEAGRNVGRALAERPAPRLAMLALLYVAQGLPFGFVTVTLATHLAARGRSVAEIGAALALATLPWTLKWAWGPLVDRFGARRSWLLAAQAAMIATLAALALVPDPAAQLAFVGALVVGHNAAAALQDVAVDALAIDLLPAAERGRASGLLYAAKYLGTLAGAVGGNHALGEVGLRGTVLAMAALLAAIGVLPLLLREPPRPARAETRSTLGLARALLRAFARVPALLGVGVALASHLGLGILAATSGVFYLHELGWDTDAYVALAGVGVACGLLGALVGGLVVDRLGARRVAVGAALLLATSWLVFAASRGLWDDRAFVAAMTMLTAALGALWMVALLAVFMDLTAPVVAASQFTAYMSLLSISTLLGYRLAGPAAAALDYAGLHVVAAATLLLAAVLLAVLPRPSPELVTSEPRL